MLKEFKLCTKVYFQLPSVIIKMFLKAKTTNFRDLFGNPSTLTNFSGKTKHRYSSSLYLFISGSLFQKCGGGGC